jgi:4-carboxymuconolactone decarboxylase
MRTPTPRITPLSDDAFTDEQRAVVDVLTQNHTLLNIYRTLAHAPDALRRFMGWGGYVLSKRNSLPARQREIVILRIGFLCKSGYEFTQHTRIGLAEGLTPEEIAAIKVGPTGPGWSPADRVLLQASDELHRDHFVSDSTWAELNAHFDEKQCMDVVFTAGQYTQVSMFLNTFGVQLDAGQTLDPDLKGY